MESQTYTILKNFEQHANLNKKCEKKLDMCGIDDKAGAVVIYSDMIDNKLTWIFESNVLSCKTMFKISNALFKIFIGKFINKYIHHVFNNIENTIQNDFINLLVEWDFDVESIEAVSLILRDLYYKYNYKLPESNENYSIIAEHINLPNIYGKGNIQKRRHSEDDDDDE